MSGAAGESETRPLVPGRMSVDPADSFRLQTVRSLVRPEFELICGLLWNIPKAVSSVVVLSLFTGDSHRCDVPLVEWTIVEVVSCVVDVALSIYFLACSSGRLRWSKYAYSWVRVFNFIWFVFGVGWVLTTQTCDKTSPQLYWLCVTLVALDFLAFFKSCILLAVMLPLVFCYLPWLLTLLPQGDHGASRALIEALPSQRYVLGMLGPNAECVICRNTYEPGTEVRVLACHPRHVFHQPCIDSWLRQNASCPMCRKRVFDTGDDDDYWQDGEDRP